MRIEKFQIYKKSRAHIYEHQKKKKDQLKWNHIQAHYDQTAEKNW